MSKEDIFVVHPKTKEEAKVLKAFMQALKIKFEVSKEENYKLDFVEKVLESRRQAKEGKVTRIKKENLRGIFRLVT